MGLNIEKLKLSDSHNVLNGRECGASMKHRSMHFNHAVLIVFVEPLEGLMGFFKGIVRDGRIHVVWRVLILAMDKNSPSCEWIHVEDTRVCHSVLIRISMLVNLT